MEIHRKLVRKFKLHCTGSSFPFISGDTYASLCDISYSGRDLSFSKKIDAFPVNQQIRLFVPLYLYESFSNWVDGVERDFSSFEIYLHNGDEPSWKPVRDLLNSHKVVVEVHDCMHSVVHGHKVKPCTGLGGV